MITHLFVGNYQGFSCLCFSSFWLLRTIWDFFFFFKFGSSLLIVHRIEALKVSSVGQCKLVYCLLGFYHFSVQIHWIQMPSSICSKACHLIHRCEELHVLWFRCMEMDMLYLTSTPTNFFYLLFFWFHVSWEYDQLSSKRRVTLSEFRGKTLVSIREYYSRDGKELPSSKGYRSLL